jgi:hypothetical protein
MNNSKIKILSVIVLLLFAGSLAMPFFAHASCDMCDLEESNKQLNNCVMDMSGENCCESMTECTVVPFHPIASAPLNKVDIQKNLTVDYNISFSENFNISEGYTFLKVVYKLYYSEVHPGFQTPLLV